MSQLNHKSLIPVFGDQNYAPLKPFLRLREGSKGTSHYVCDALKERFSHYIGLDRSVRNEIIAVGQLIALFIEGKQFLAPDPFSGGYRILQPKREDHTTRRAMNMTQFYATNWLTKWCLSNPNIIIRPGRDTDKSIGAAKAADVIVDHYESKYYRPWFNQQQGLLCITFGTYLERVRHDPGIKGNLGLREIMEDREIRLGEGSGYCGSCQKVGIAADFAAPVEMMDGSVGQADMCPNCGSESVLVVPPAVGNVTSVVGQEQVEMGDLRCDHLPMPASWWNLKKRAEESEFFIYRQRIMTGVIHRLLGNIRIPGGENGPTDLGLDVIEMLGKSGQALAGYSGHGSRYRNRQMWEDAVNLDEMWLQPECYADIKIKGDEETVAGVNLPGGASLADVFPEGLVAVGLNGMNLVLGLYPEKHSDHITSGVCHMKPLSGAGRGQADAIEPQKRLNKFDSQGMNYMDGVSTPAILYNSDVIQEEEVGYLGHPKANIAVDLSRLPQTARLADAVLPLPPGSLPAQFVQYTQEFLNNMFQLSWHVTDFSNGLPGVDNGTATGAKIATANSNSLFGPVLQIKGEVRMGSAEKTINLYRKHFPLDQYFPLGGEHSTQPGIWLSGVDLEGADLVYDWERDSEVPKNNFTKREDAMAFFALFGGFLGYMQALEADPQFVTELARIWNMRIKAQDYDVVGQRCQTRVEQMQQGLKQGAVNPLQLIQLINPPVSQFEPNHKQKAEWWSNWLDTDDALRPENFPLRAAAEVLIQMHFSFAGGIAVAQAAQAAEVGAVARPPQEQQPPPQEKRAA